MNELDFISETTLRKRIEDSIEYIYVIFEDAKKKTQNPLFQEETYRVIILYVVSIIEVILLYLYKARKDELTLLEYKYVVSLPEKYRYRDKDKAPLVIAVQETVVRADHQIGIFELVNFYKEKKLIKKETAEAILDLNSLRNTFHLGKPREELVCDLKRVELALNLLVHTIQNAPKTLKIKV